LSSATLDFAAWWDIEAGYDYAYVQISTDNGQTWQTLRATSTTGDDPTGANYGWGYTDRSGGWSEESVDLSAYAGQPVLIRFQSITDAALVEPGFAVDDIAIPELNYAEDFEAGDGGWQAEGFVRMDNTLAQRFVVQLIRQGSGATTVEQLELDGANRARYRLEAQAGETLTLVIAGVTRFTTEPAEYSFAIERTTSVHVALSAQA
jgi:bacillopeptidase F (M6 metalloprotease family)